MEMDLADLGQIVGVRMAFAMPSKPSESCPRHGRRTFESKDAEPVDPHRTAQMSL